MTTDAWPPANTNATRTARGAYSSLLVAGVALACAVLLVRGAAAHHDFSVEVRISGAGASLPALVYEEAMLLYRLTTVNVSVSYEAVGSGEGLRLLEEGRVDFAASDVLQPRAGLAFLPTMAAAIVTPVNLGESSMPLVLDRFTLPAIFSGEIERWDDPRLAAINPQLAVDALLPAAPIRVVARSDVSGTTAQFTQALSMMSPAFAAAVGSGAVVDWPIPSERLVLVNGSDAVSAAVVNELHSIGYNVLEQAIRHTLPVVLWHPRTVEVPGSSDPMDLPRAAWANGSEPVQPGSAALLNAAIEWKPRFAALVHSDLTLTDAAGSWPIAGFTYLVLRQQYVRNGTSCLERLATREFWEWFLDNDGVEVLSSGYGFLLSPDIVVQRVQQTMNAAIGCGGDEEDDDGIEEASDDALGLSAFVLAGPVELEAVSNLLGLAYQALSRSSTPLKYSRVLRGEWMEEPPMLSLLPEPWLYDFAERFGAGIQLPLGALGLAVLYNLHVDHALILSTELLSEILLGVVTEWRDPRIAALNPQVDLPELPIKLVTRADACEENLILTASLSGAVRSFNESFGVTYNPHFGAAATHVRSQAGVVTYVARTPGALSYGRPVDGLGVPFAGLRVEGATTDAESFDLTLIPERLTDCVAPVSLSDVDFDGDGGVCWPLSVRVYAYFKADWSSSAPIEQGCTAGAAVGEFMHWYYANEEVEPTLESFFIGAPSDEVRRMLLPELDGIKCDGLSILNEPPECTASDTYFVVSECTTESTRSVDFFWNQPKICERGYLLPQSSTDVPCDHEPWGTVESYAIVGMVAFAMAPPLWALRWTYKNIDTETVKYMQPTFCLIFLYGVLASNITPLLFLGPDNRALCTARVWFFNVTFTLTFTALFSKLYRVWRLFVNPKARKRIITNAQLIRIILLFVGIDVVLCLMWSVLDPPGDVVSTVDVPALTVDIPVVKCVDDQTTAPFEVLLLFFKIVLLSGGIFLSFQTWNVDAMVAEARPLASAIFNIAFVGLVAAVVIVGFGVESRVEVALITIASLYSNTAAVVAVFAPKVSALRASQTGSPATGSVRRVSTGGATIRTDRKPQLPAHKRAVSAPHNTVNPLEMRVG